jgi:gliding motility-associated-like protein
MEIYNRWGEKVFSTTDINGGWDGTFNGLPLPLAAYYYVIKFNFPGEEKNYYHSGTVTIVK